MDKLSRICLDRESVVLIMWAMMSAQDGERQAVLVSELGDELSALRLSTPAELQEMERSLMRMGQLTPLLVYRKGLRLEVIDGLKRLRAAQKLRWEKLAVEVTAVDEIGAKLRMLWVNRRCGMTEIEEGWLVRSLYRQDGLTQPQISHLVGRDKSWVSRRLMLVEGLCSEVQANLRLGLLTATAARELGRLPRGNQFELSQVVTRRGLTTRQAAKLVDEFLKAGEGGSLEEVLSQMEGSRRERRRAGDPGQMLIADIAGTQKLATRLMTRLLSRPLLSFGRQSAEVAASHLEQLQGVLRSLAQVIERSLERRKVVEDELEQLPGTRAPDCAPVTAGDEPARHFALIEGEP